MYTVVRSLDCYLTNSMLKKQSQLFIYITLTIFNMTCLGMLIYLILDRAILKNIIRDSCRVGFLTVLRQMLTGQLLTKEMKKRTNVHPYENFNFI